MEFQSWNCELGIANLLFKNIFNNIRIVRTNDQGVEKQVLVQCVLGQRSRILKNLQNPERRGNMKVPMIVIERTGYTRNGDRLNNLHNEVKYELGPAYRKYHLMTPVPIDISYDVSIIAKYPSDIDKIASNFMIFFNSDIYVSCEHPKYHGVKLNNQVIMSDSVNEDHPSEIDGSADDLMTSTFNFTFKTYLFGGTKKANLVDLKVPSAYMSSFISSYVIEIAANQIDDFQKQYPNKNVSATLTTEVTAMVTSYVDSPSAQIYDDVPVIDNISFGFYVVPQDKDIMEYIASVDNGAFGPHYHESLCGYISSESYTMPPQFVIADPYLADTSAGIYDDPLSMCYSSAYNQPMEGNNDYYDIVDDNCSLAPYVDKIYWKIDSASIYTYPNDIKWERG